MLWTLLSIVVAFAELIAFMSADWLIGKAKSRSGVEPAGGGPSEPYHPTLGIYARCIRNPGVQHVPRDTLCGPYAESFGEIASGFWQATAIFLAVGIFILCMVALVSVFTMCVQSIMKKSIFNVCGLLQGIAGKEPECGRLRWGAPWTCWFHLLPATFGGTYQVSLFACGVGPFSPGHHHPARRQGLFLSWPSSLLVSSLSVLLGLT